MKDILVEHIGEIVTVVLAAIGGIFALLQWKKSNDYKRADLINGLINKIRDDKDIAKIMDIIDWNDGLKYDGEFSISPDSNAYEIMEHDENLFQKIDSTLSHFSYICYLNKLHVFKRVDMCVFDYEIKRIFDNPEISNYLYSLFLWSVCLNVACPYKHLIVYGLRKKYLQINFLSRNSKSYYCYLKVEERCLIRRIFALI